VFSRELMGGIRNPEGFKGSPSSHNPRRLRAYSWVRIYPYSFQKKRVMLILASRPLV
jgi:hypothetical protein